MLKKFRNMIVCFGNIVLLLFLFVVSNVSIVSAEGEPIVVTGKAVEDSVFLYVNNVGAVSGGTVQIGNVKYDDISMADILGSGMPIETIFMLDESLSMQSAFGEKAKEFMTGMVNSHSENEKFKVVTYAEELVTLVEFTDDYESLNNSISAIEFKDKDTYVSEALYSELMNNKASNGAAYRRVILITDAVEDGDIPYTNEELTSLMKELGMPIHILGVQTRNNTDVLKDLFSFSRVTNASYMIVDKNSTVDEIIQTINADYQMKVILVKPNSVQLDGSNKDIQLSLETDAGSVTMTTTVKMPFGNVVEVESEEESEEPTEEITEEPTEETTENTLPQIGPQPEAEPEKEAPVVLIIICCVSGCLVVVAIVVVVLILVSKKKKNSNTVVEEQPVEEPVLPVQFDDEEDNRTVMLSASAFDDQEEEKTTFLWGVSRETKTYISLRDLNDSSRSYRAEITDKVVIGRNACDITVENDKSISGKHCEIIKKGELYYLNDLRSSNGTVYSGSPVHSETPIMEGGVLEIGKQKFSVHFVKE